MVLRLSNSNIPMTWKLLKQYHMNPPNVVFPRNKEVFQSYIDHKNKLKAENINITDYITKQLFTKENSYKLYSLIDNKFPYLLEPEIMHKLLWFNPKITNTKHFPDDLNNVPEFINDCLINHTKNIYDLYDIIYFENIVECRSVPGIRHIQLFLKSKN